MRDAHEFDVPDHMTLSQFVGHMVKAEARREHSPVGGIAVTSTGEPPLSL
jgi:hypothetical protein